jgi:hypothetical protein
MINPQRKRAPLLSQSCASCRGLAGPPTSAFIADGSFVTVHRRDADEPL